ncbi:UDPglucose 6-dehydrogenase [Leifsonia sp. AK011]|uniref:UDP-glucose dehydrogenase family protein n=1 Tax=Leifsonia sp. AK011 TaxID=2723075 RepID=UPI0015C85E22|nr:UDP-glucose/GDP-mannose dehydrogenase family protein [Leifsonia sp. AK011]NYF11567.1 UDPglucose 6-dehydrogenase [Leifsonia sp. AK011]
MKISVIGCGYLGAVHAACMAELGHDVVGIDVDAAKIASLSAGAAPFFEPGLPELLSSGVASGRLRFSTNIEETKGATVHFVAVGTPQKPGSDAADLRFVDASFEALLTQVGPGDLVVGKSTVPVGTAARLSESVEAAGATLAWNPEFLREGFAVKDTLAPDRLVYGVKAGDAASVATLDDVYATAIAAETPRLVTDYATAELVKVAANAFLATKISFINAMSVVADATGANITELADAIGHDARIGRRFLNAGVGFGGGCLPKDIRGFMARADELGVGDSLDFLKNVDAINLAQRERVVQLALAAAGGDLAGTRVAILGLAFKPDSDDVRDSPALDVAVRLKSLGATVLATDPEAIETSRRVQPDLDYVATLEEAAKGADIVLLLTEWKQYRELDPAALAEITAGRTIIDGRNVLDSARWREAGWEYRGLGRP